MFLLFFLISYFHFQYRLIVFIFLRAFFAHAIDCSNSNVVEGKKDRTKNSEPLLNHLKWRYSPARRVFVTNDRNKSGDDDKEMENSYYSGNTLVLVMAEQVGKSAFYFASGIINKFLKMIFVLRIKQKESQSKDAAINAAPKYLCPVFYCDYQSYYHNPWFHFTLNFSLNYIYILFYVFFCFSYWNYVSYICLIIS